MTPEQKQENALATFLFQEIGKKHPIMALDQLRVYHQSLIRAFEAGYAEGQKADKL